MLNLKTNSCDFRSGCDEMCDEQSRVGENWSHTRWLWFVETITFRKAKINTLTTFSNTKVFLSCGWMLLFLIFDDFITAIYQCHCLQTHKKLWNKKTPVRGLFICLFGVFFLDAVSDVIIITSFEVVSHLCVARQKPSLRTFMKISLPWPFRLWKSSCY